jgi:hypothetical protein
VLNGLGPEFNSFVVVVTIIAISCTDPLHFTDIHGLLLSHEALLTAQTPQTSLPSFSSPTAFYTRSTHPNKYNPRPNTYRHPKPFPPPQTPKSPSYQYQPQPTASKFVCQICSKPVHSVKICHWRYDIPNLSPYQAFTLSKSVTGGMISQICLPIKHSLLSHLLLIHHQLNGCWTLVQQIM